jgi:IS30 family transposase
VPKLACPRLAAQVAALLEEWWAPEEIARRLRIEFPTDPMMWVSHETTYQALFVQGRGELRRELARCLRTSRAARRPRGRNENPGRIPGMVMISDRPAEAADRAVPGHWEGDLIVGKASKSAVGTLAERTTRFVLLLHLPDGKDARAVDAAMSSAIATLPGELFRSITWDQGMEMSRHAAFSVDTGIAVYFCDPHSPGSAAPTRTPTACCASTCPKAPTSRSTPPRTSPASPAASTTDPARPSAS